MSYIPIRDLITAWNEAEEITANKDILLEITENEETQAVINTTIERAEKIQEILGQYITDKQAEKYLNRIN